MAIRSTALAVVLLFVAVAVQAADAAKSAAQKLEPDVHIALPKALKLKAYPMPIPGASNYRIDTGDMRIAITGIPLSEDGQTVPLRSDDDLKAMALQGAAQYRGNAANPEATANQLKGQGWVATYVSYAAAPGSRGFVPFMGAAYQCVSTGQLMTGHTVFVFTVGSPDCDGAGHQDFLKALETVTVDG